MAKDLFHDAVREALKKEDWHITDDPLTFQVGGMDLRIDLGAEKLIVAEKEGQKIAVEIKSFVKVSAIYEFHLAIGQYRNYILALQKEEPDRVLYLAIPDDTYRQFFILPFVQDAIEFNRVNYLVYDVVTQVVVKWKRQSDTDKLFNK